MHLLKKIIINRNSDLNLLQVVLQQLAGEQVMATLTNSNSLNNHNRLNKKKETMETLKKD